MNPSEKKLLKALNAINSQIKPFIKDIIADTVGNHMDYLVKTEYAFNRYNVIIFNKLTNSSVGYSFPLKLFLDYVSKKQIEFEMNKQVKRILIESKDYKGAEIKWIS